jgi:hypothetical protein
MPNPFRRGPKITVPFAFDETDDPATADRRGYFKVELWSKDNERLEDLLWAGSNLEIAHEKLAAAIRHRPRGRYKIRQGVLTIAKWPDANA